VVEKAEEEEDGDDGRKEEERKGGHAEFEPFDTKEFKLGYHEIAENDHNR